jgi:hypothetical protein
MAVLSIDVIEAKLADAGYDTIYTGEEHYTSFLIRGGSKELEILDAVSGDSFCSENLTEAVIYSERPADATRDFESVETVEEFLEAVARQFA